MYQRFEIMVYTLFGFRNRVVADLIQHKKSI